MMEILQCQESTSGERMILKSWFCQESAVQNIYDFLFFLEPEIELQKAYRKSEKALHFAYFKSEQRRISQMPLYKIGMKSIWFSFV